MPDMQNINFFSHKYHTDTNTLAKDCKCSLHGLKLIAVNNRNTVPSNRTCSDLSFDLTKAKYSISKLSVVEKTNVIVRINLINVIACEENKINLVIKMKFIFNIYTQILTTIT